MATTNVVSELSDTDLRQRLKSFGHNVGPVTKTTRKILEKRLAKFLESGNNGTDDSDSGAEKTQSQKKPTTMTKVNNRTSIGGAGRRSITPNTRKFAPFSSDEEEETYRSGNSKKATPTTKSKTKNDFVDPNDIIIQSSVTPSSQATPRGSNRRKSSQDLIRSVSVGTGASPVTSISNQSYKKTVNLNEFSDDDFSGAESSARLSTSIQNRHTEIRNHFKSTNGNSVESSTNDGSVAGTTTGGRYGFTKLSSAQSSSNDVSSTPDGIRDEIDASLTEMRNTFRRKQPSPAIRKKDSREKETDCKTLPKKVSCFQKCKSSVIMGLKIMSVVVLLFGALFIYIYKDTNTIIGIEESKGDHVQMHEGVNCIYNKLSLLAGKVDCGYTESKWVKKEEFSQFGADLCLIDKEANIYNIISDNSSTYIQYFDFNDVGDVSSKSSHRTLYCRINQAISTIMFRILIIGAVMMCGVIGYFILKKRWTADDEETRQVLHFVERIIDTLQRHHEVTQTTKDIPQFLPIPHVRDMLIPVIKRKKMAKVWQKAVDFLNSSDSRVRVETQRIAGEDFDVWRWIGVCTPKLKKKERKATNETYLSNEQEKSWQGPAFDEIEKVVRMPIVTPTPCLKIRYMHEGLDEKEENWVKRVENAVLEKCNKDGAQILHIFVDKTSKEGCVYVKCESLESAGKAFRCMYGNWFDCRLVIVKFVTLARYHQRFPDALKCLTSLQPDPQMPSSLNWVAENDK